jgi:U3 small nucleolar RNA-associated protein 22
MPAAPENLFSESKLRPAKNSIRPKQESENHTITPLSPSPFYNASIKSDCNFEAYLQLLHTTSKQVSGFKDACILGRIWLRQRGFSSSVSDGGFGHFEWTALTALLLKGGGPKGRNLLSPGYSSYQIFKAMIQYLATSDFILKPQSVEAVNSSIPHSEFSIPNSSVPMFYDGPRGQNILYKMTSSSYALLLDEAKISLDMLNEAIFDQFEPAFIIRAAQPLQRFDCLTRVSIPAQIQAPNSCDHKSHIANFSGRLFEVLQEGLMDRVKVISIKEPELPCWSIKSMSPSLSENMTLQVAVVFDAANIGRTLDKGPLVELEKKQALKFQKFWGEKAEWRKFSGSIIHETLRWSPGSSYTIYKDIFTYLMKHHFDAEVSESLKFIGDGFENLLPGSQSSMKGFDPLKEALNTFEKNIRDFDDNLPLQLRQLSAIDPQLRYSAVGLPSFSPQQPLIMPANVLIQFEGTGRWPDDVVAIQRTKIAFLLKIGSLLQESDNGITTRLGLENEDMPLQNCSFLDVIYPSGAAFRLRIHNDREQTLLERHVKDKSSDYRLREDAVRALSAYKRTFILLPLHTQSIATHCTRFPLLSPTIRLVKTWFYRHMLSGHISDELIELLVVHAFVQPYPWRAPSSTMSGFLRTLSFISRWDWRLTPLIVDFTGEMTSNDVKSINTRLEAWRKIDPGMNRTVIFAASNHDMTGTGFSDTGPSKVIAARMTALARSACKVIKDQGVDLNPKSLFAASTANYDFVIHLAPKFARESKQKEASKPKFKNLEVQSEVELDLVGYNPVQCFVEELEKLYTNTIVFFHCAGAGTMIGALWNPQTVPSRTFKVNLAYATKLAIESKEDGGVELDKSAILSEISRLGGDMVTRIEVH